MYMNLSTFLALKNPVLNFLNFWAVEHYLKHFLVKTDVYVYTVVSEHP